MFSRRTVVSGALALLLPFGLAACGSSGTDGSTSASASPAAAGSSPAQTPAASPAAALTVTDPWVKAADKGMTSAFATLVNNTDTQLTVVSASSPAAARVELHEVVEKDGEMAMQQKEGGFVIPARGSHTLQPGGDHLMLMDLTGQVRPGDEVAFTLTLSDGSTVEFTAVAKDFAGGDEKYHGDESHGDRSDGDKGHGDETEADKH
ncbi:copper chaperone PCu(A)C [Thermopolyspora flexuosa]|uniref:Copper(I)-binding protein n=1 Tax=Thermopolyspora flexuosa TaxID=103836 RepID=A0A543J4B0_9ACTN|nr:copper chaperone PCu(A)C [Thermopolyspora flexuosa]TQM77670.1 hypothetical protein FHX40_4441 [Thermopolyspora flexuosa]